MIDVRSNRFIDAGFVSRRRHRSESESHLPPRYRIDYEVTFASASGQSVLFETARSLGRAVRA